MIGLVVIVAVKYFPMSGSKESAVVTHSGWVEVTPPTRLFTANFPVSPERAEAELPIPGTDYSILQESHVAIDGKENVFRIVTFVYPQPFSAEEANTVLDSALQGMIAAVPGSVLLKNTPAIFDDLPGKIFTIQDKNGYYHEGQMFLKGRVLYQALVTYDAGDVSEEELNYFLDSFTPTVDAKI